MGNAIKYIKQQITQSDPNLPENKVNPGRREKINWSFYFQTFLWCLKKFYEGLKGIHKTFWGTTKNCENDGKG